MSDAKVVITAEDRASNALRELRTLSDGLRGSLDSLAPAFAALAASAGAVAGVRSIVEGLAKLKDAKEATGATVENLSALEDVAVRAGGSFDEATAVLVKFNKALIEAKPGSDVALIFERLGLSLQQLKTADPVTALQKTALAFQQFADDGSKGRAFLELFGKSVREAAPLLNELAEAGELNAKATSEQVLQADKFVKQLAALQKNSIDTSRQFVSQFLPTLSAIIDEFKRGEGSANAFATAGQGVRVAFETLAVLGANLKFVFEGTGRTLGGIAAQLRALATGDLDAFRAINEMIKEDDQRARAALDAFEKRMLGAGDATQSTTAKLKEITKSFGELGTSARFTAEQLKLFRSANEGFAGDAEARIKILDEQNKKIEHLNDLLGRTNTRKLFEDLGALDDAFFRPGSDVGPDEYDAAVARRTGRAMDALKEIQREVKDSTDFAKEFGLTFASSLEDAIVKGEGLRQVLQGIYQDLLRILVRTTITEKLGNWFTDLLKGKGSLGGAGAFVGPPDFLAGGASSGGSVKVFNITVQNGQSPAETAAAVRVAIAASEARIVDGTRRGGVLAGL